MNRFTSHAFYWTPLCILFVVTMYMNISFDRDVDQRLKRAADANTITIAKEELGAAVHELERRNVTSGYTSIFYNTPDEDLGFWYRNLKASYDELDRIAENTSQLERTNVLMKLRQTLLDHSNGNERVTVPCGACFYPNNGTVAGLLFLFLFIGVAGSIYTEKN